MPPHVPRELRSPLEVPQMAAKFFTIDEANRTLPFVSRIVRDIVEEYRHWREHLYRYELIAANRKSGEDENDEQVRLRRLVDDSAQRINGFIEEIALVGCVFKGFEDGLVDFRSNLNGREVFLCWKMGEASVEYFHEVDTGYTQRQPLEAATVGPERE